MILKKEYNAIKYTEHMIMRLETIMIVWGYIYCTRSLYRSSVIGHSGTQLFETSQNFLWLQFKTQNKQPAFEAEQDTFLKCYIDSVYGLAQNSTS